VKAPISDRVDRALDAALEMTFPASDPIAVPISEASATARDDPTLLAGAHGLHHIPVRFRPESGA
jgi:hypothetical protein